MILTELNKLTKENKLKYIGPNEQNNLTYFIQSSYLANYAASSSGEAIWAKFNQN